MSRFFVARPIFAWVIAILIMLAGILSITTLSISQYPQIAPTTVKISATYSGADAATVENSVTKVIEQGMTGIDNLDYMTSTSQSSGAASISLTFTNKADADVAQMQVQNKLQLVEAQLPTSVQSSGLTVTKSTANFLMVAGFVSTDGKLSSTDLADYVNSTLNDTLKRVPGVGDTQLFGSGYAMRIWVDPDKLAKYSLMVSDVTSAIESQNTQVAAGQLGALPQAKGQQLNATVTAKSRLQTPEQFANIILKSDSAGSLVRLNDVATVELGAESYSSSSHLQRPSLGRHRHHACIGRQCDRYGGSRAIDDFGDEANAAAERRSRLSLRHDTVRQAVHRGCDQDADRSDRARLHRDVRVPAEPARHTDPDARRSDRSSRHLRHSVGVRLFDQHADHVRHGAGHRPPGR
jgi:multidrug efflux pump